MKLSHLVVAALLAALGVFGWWWLSSEESELPAAAAPSVRLPADFENKQLLAVACHEMNELHPEFLGDLADAVGGKLQVVSLAADAEEQRKAEERLQDRGLKGRVRFVTIPHDSVWIRDFGPICVEDSDGKAALLDADYYFDHRKSDDLVPAALSRQFGWSCQRLPLFANPGNLLSNGQGLVLSTYTLIGQNVRAGLDEQAVRAMLRERLGVEQLVLLEPLAGEITGHVDIFATFTSPDTVVVGKYPAKADPTNAAILDRNAARLAEVRTPRGQLRVERIAMPPHDQVLWPTYTNVVYVNGVLLMPTYPLFDAEGSLAARELYERLLPDWKIVEIDAAPLVQNGGALRCATLTLGGLGDLRPVESEAKTTDD